MYCYLCLYSALGLRLIVDSTHASQATTVYYNANHIGDRNGGLGDEEGWGAWSPTFGQSSTYCTLSPPHFKYTANNNGCEF